MENFCGGDAEGTFRITVENIPCGDSRVVCTKSIALELYDTRIHLIHGSRPIVTVDPDVSTKAQYPQMELIGRYLVVHTQYGGFPLRS